MINALRTNNKAYITAQWCPENGNRSLRKTIKVEIVTPIRREYAQTVQNLIADKNSAMISTEYNYEFKQSDELYLLESWWTIVSVGFDYRMDKTDSVSLVRPKYANMRTILEVVLKG